MKVEVVIFDMDGVLVDSEPFGFEALRRVMARYGLGYSEEENAEFLGRTTLESCRILKARHALPDAAEILADFYIEGMLAQIAAGPIPMPGVPDVLERVRAGGYRLALASSAEVRVIQANLTALALGSLFEAVVSGTQVARGKPAPDVFLAAADAARGGARSLSRDRGLAQRPARGQGRGHDLRGGALRPHAPPGLPRGRPPADRAAGAPGPALAGGLARSA